MKLNNRFNIYIICILYLIGISSEITFGQNKKFTRVDDSFIYNLIDSANTHLISNPSLSFEFTEQALKQSIQNRNQETEAISYQVLGRINHEIEQYDIANSYFEKACKLFKKNEQNELLYQTYIYYSKTLNKLQDIENSIELLNRSLTYYKKEKNARKESEILQAIAQTYEINNDNKGALNNYLQALDIEEKEDNIENVVEIQQNIGSIYLEEKKEEKAISSYKASVQSARSLNDKVILSNSLENQSKAFRKNKRFKEELEVRKELSNNYTEENKVDALADNKIEMAEIYMAMENSDGAEQEILETIEITKKSANLKKQGVAYKKLSGVYDYKKDYDKALIAYRNYVATVDKIHAEQEEEIQSSIKLYANLNRKLERLDMVEQDLALNRRNVELLQQEQNLNDKELIFQRRLSYVLLGVLIALALASLLIYRSSLNKRKVNQLLALKSLRSQMNPHFIYNSLNSINNFIAKNDERSANKYLTSFSRLMRSVMDNSKDDFVFLQSEIEILKLYLDLEYTRFPDKFEYKIDISENLDVENVLIPPMLIQPYIENAIWHGLRYKEEKGFLNLFFKMDNSHLIITIEDNGIGRTKSKQLKTRYQKEHKSMGLKNIENRVAIIKNVFNVAINITIEDLDVTNNTGTRVVISTPLYLQKNKV